MIGMGEALRRISDTPRRPLGVLELGEELPAAIATPAAYAESTVALPFDWSLLESLSLSALAPAVVDCVEIARPPAADDEAVAQFSVQFLPGEAALAPQSPTPPASEPTLAVEAAQPDEVVEIESELAVAADAARDVEVALIVDEVPIDISCDDGMHDEPGVDEEFVIDIEPVQEIEFPPPVAAIDQHATIEVVAESASAELEPVPNCEPVPDAEHEYELEPAATAAASLPDDPLLYELDPLAATVSLATDESGQPATDEFTQLVADTDWNRIEAALDSAARLVDAAETDGHDKHREHSAAELPLLHQPQLSRDESHPSVAKFRPPAAAASHALADYRQLRNNILAQFPPGAPMSIALVSVHPGVEHARLAAHLAQVLAERNAGDVLAVDADVDHAGLANELFDDSIDIDQIMATQGASFAALLHKQRTVDEVAVATSFPKVWAIPAHARRNDDSHAAEPARVDPLLVMHCKRLFPQVLLSVGSIESRTAIPLARQCDAAYLVVDLGRTDRQAAVAALARLELGGVRVLGCVLTGVPAK